VLDFEAPHQSRNADAARLVKCHNRLTHLRTSNSSQFSNSGMRRRTSSRTGFSQARSTPNVYFGRCNNWFHSSHTGSARWSMSTTSWRISYSATTRKYLSSLERSFSNFDERLALHRPLACRTARVRHPPRFLSLPAAWDKIKNCRQEYTGSDLTTHIVAGKSTLMPIGNSEPAMATLLVSAWLAAAYRACSKDLPFEAESAA
jgi:hypothetical protein